MLRIRLQRFGKKRAPIYRISVLEKSTRRDGRPVEVIGFYNPKTKDLYFNKERAEYWVSKGAQPTETVAVLLKREPNHDLAKGPVKFVAKSRKDKEEARSARPSKPSKKKREKEKAKSEAPKEEAPAAEEKPAEEASAEAPAEEKPAEEKAEAPAEEPKAEEKTEEAPKEEAAAS